MKHKKKGVLSLSVNKPHKRRTKTAEDCFLELDRLRAVLDAVPGYASWVGSDLRYLGANKKLASALGVSPEDLVGKKVGFQTKDHTFSRFIRSVFLSPTQGIEKTILHNIHNKDCYLYLIGRKYAQDKAAVILGFDITKEKKNEELIRDQNQSILEAAKLSALGVMAAALAHEINNPLCIILAQAELALQCLADKDHRKLTSKLQDIRGTCLKMKEIVDGLRGFLHQGEKPVFSKCSVKEILKDTEILSRSYVKKTKVQLDMRIPKKDIFIECQKTQIEEVLFNLIQNSCDAVSQKKKRWIRVEVVEKRQRIQFLVTDSGRGIPSSVQANLFDPLFTTKAYGKGTGLGLSVSQNISKRHGGELSINKAHKNTQFILEILKKAS